MVTSCRKSNSPLGRVPRCVVQRTAVDIKILIAIFKGGAENGFPRLLADTSHLTNKFFIVHHVLMTKLEDLHLNASAHSSVSIVTIRNVPQGGRKKKIDRTSRPQSAAYDSVTKTTLETTHRFVCGVSLPRQGACSLVLGQVIRKWCHMQHTNVTFIVAPCLIESIYCSLTNKCTFKNLNLHENTQLSFLHVSVFDHPQGACTEPG